MKQPAKQAEVSPEPIIPHSDMPSKIPSMNGLESSVASQNLVEALPRNLTEAITKLQITDHCFLLHKQASLKTNELDIPRGFRRHASAVDATLVFAQEEAGTAVCVSAGGLLLTCSHCVAETRKDLEASKTWWLLFKSGMAVKAICLAWDSRRDLALLQIVAAQFGNGSEEAGGNQLPFVNISDASPTKNAPVVCIGHPGSEDLEASQSGLPTNYDVLHVSTGRFRGHAEQDLQDNSDIGALMHDCWTYWGHSGAPILDWSTGTLVGLHSSWDDETGMRRGIPWEAIKAFFEIHG